MQDERPASAMKAIHGTPMGSPAVCHPSREPQSKKKRENKTILESVQIYATRGKAGSRVQGNTEGTESYKKRDLFNVI